MLRGYRAGFAAAHEERGIVAHSLLLALSVLPSSFLWFLEALHLPLLPAAFFSALPSPLAVPPWAPSGGVALRRRWRAPRVAAASAALSSSGAAPGGASWCTAPQRKGGGLRGGRHPSPSLPCVRAVVLLPLSETTPPLVSQSHEPRSILPWSSEWLLILDPVGVPLRVMRACQCFVPASTPADTLSGRRSVFVLPRYPPVVKE